MDAQEEVARSVERVRLELSTRKLMIMMMALTGVLTGAAIMLTGAPNFIEEWFSPWSRYLVGGSAFAAGLTTTVGGFIGDRVRVGWWTQIAGLFGLAAWNASMAAAYLAVVIRQGAGFVGPGEPLAADVTGRGYVPILYLGLMVVIMVPMVTMIRLRRPDVYGSRDF